MSPAERTVAHELSSAGYATSYIGKWHLYGGDAPANTYRRVPVPRTHQGGFDRWQGFEYRNDPFDTYYFVDDDTQPHRLDGYQTDALFDLALQELRRLGTGEPSGAEAAGTTCPFFLSLSVEPPHPPYQGPRFFENSRRMEPHLVDGVALRPNVDVERLAVNKPGLLKGWRELQSRLAANADSTRAACRAAGEFTDTQVLQAMLLEYGQAIENVDANVGRLIDALASRGLWDNTIVIFFADHGEMLGSHGSQAKQLPFQESVGIPLIIAGGPVEAMKNAQSSSTDNPSAAASRAEQVVNTPVSIEDIFPTTLELAGVVPPYDDQPGRCAGQSIVPLLKQTGDTSAGATVFSRDAVFLEFVEEHRENLKSIPPWRGIRTERFAYSVTCDGPWMLFDLDDDPYEMTNLVCDPSRSQLRERMHTRLFEHLRSIADPFERVHQS
jgi:arylsulfatase A-like enzyme